MVDEKNPDPRRMTPREYGRWLAQQAPPITAEQARAAARILATVKPEDVQGCLGSEEVTDDAKSVDGDGT